MTNYALWLISYFSLYLAILWIILIYLSDHKVYRSLKRVPWVTLVVPAHDEEQGIRQTVESLLALEYPRDKLSILVIDDGSTDRTGDIVSAIANDNSRVRLIAKKQGGKAAALNYGLRTITTEYFSCVDADSHVAPDALRRMIPRFAEPNTAAVISAVKVDAPQTFYEKLQRVEYLIAIQARRLMASIDILAMTPGVLSVYKTDIVRSIGCFDEHSIVEDFEIALKLKYHGYSIQIAHDAVTYTKVPHNFVQLWRQRIRWYRGFIDTHVKYKDMFFSKRYGLLGWFQMPVNMLGIITLIVAVSIISYTAITNTIDFVIRSVRIDNYFVNHVLSFPSFKDFWLSQDMKIMLPIYLSTIAGIILIYTAHRLNRERLRDPISLWAYFFLLPYLFFLHWMGTFFEKIFRVKQRW
jgi:poly-beta-1,6-N-acetyl-D-glucosamine synthase